MLGVSGIPPIRRPRIFRPSYLAAASKAFLKANNGDQNIAFGIAVKTLAPSAFFIIGIRFAIEPSCAVIAAE